jgi:hypothetical protein
VYYTRKGERASVVFAFLVLSSCKVLRHGPPEEDAALPIESINVASASATVTASAPDVDAGDSVPHVHHHGKAPSVRAGNFNVNGRLPPEVIQRIVRQNFGRFRGCYQAGLASNPTLEGRVTSQFVIDRTGNVSVAKDGGSDLPDATVVECVVSSFKALSFPAPEGGIVVVSAPLFFSPTS